jgi:predicted ATPase
MAGMGAAVGASQGAPVETGAVNNDTEYALINSTDDLETGKSYMITNGTEGTVKTMIKTANTNNRRTTEVTVDETTHRITRGANALSVTLEEEESVLHFKTDNYGGTAGYFASADAGTNSNYLLVSATAGAVTISFSGDAAVINIGPHASRKIVRYNAGSGATPTPLFSCYASIGPGRRLFMERS